MVKFNPILCNFEKANTHCGQDILVNWSYQNTFARNIHQESAIVYVYEDQQLVNLLFSSKPITDESMSYHLSEFMDLQELTDYYIVVCSTFSDGSTSTSNTCHLRTGIFSLNFWTKQECHWINPRLSQKNIPAAIEFRKIFKLTKTESTQVESAYAYLFATGFTTLEVNGTRTDDRILAPANSVYENHCYYETYDIKNALCVGTNTLSLVTGSGYDASYSQYGYRFFGKKGLLGLVEIKFNNGTVKYYPSNTTWTCHDTNITSCSLYHGESLDATKEELKRIPVTIDDSHAPYYPNGILLPREIPQIRVIRKDEVVTSYPSTIPERKADPDSNFPGVPAIEGTLFDFGEVSTGIVSIQVKADKGTVVRLFHTEMILPNGSPDRYTNRSALATDTYICSGNGIETFIPEFTYHCFRYVHVSGIDAKNIVHIEKQVLSTDFENTGFFECSDGMINRLHKIMITGIRNNMMSIPTDCAVRDERTPCAMDSQAIEKSVMFNFATASYYTKWLQDICDKYRAGNGIGNPDWSGDIVSLMWRIRNFYGDLRPAKTFFDDGVRLFLTDCEQTTNGLWEKGYGDWCNPNQNSWDTFFGSVTSVNTCLLYAMGQKLLVLGKEIDANSETLAKIEKETARIKKAFNEKCVKKDGTVLGGRQTELIMPLYVNILSDENSEKVKNKLLRKLIKEQKNDIGIYGAMTLFEILTRLEESDLATSLLHNPEYPGYGFLLAKGATSLWEQWRYKGRMDSHSHGMFAGPDASFYQMYAGITPVAPAFKEILICPQLPESMNYSKATLETPVGQISVSTEYLCQGYELTIAIPIGCKATVVFPKAPFDNLNYAFFDGEKPTTFSSTRVLENGIYHFRFIPEYLQEDH